MKAYRIVQHINDYDFMEHDGEHIDMVLGYAFTLDTVNQIVIGWAFDNEIQREYTFFTGPGEWTDSNGEDADWFYKAIVEEIDIQE